MKTINLKRFASYLERLNNGIGLKVYSIKRDETYKDAYNLKFTSEYELRSWQMSMIEDQIEESIGKYLYDISVERDSEANIENDNDSLYYGIISLGFQIRQARIVESEEEASVFARKFDDFISNLWKNDVEKKIIRNVYKYRQRIKKDPEKGKQYLNDLYTNNKDLIDSNASKEFKDELSKLINDYKGDDQLNELQDHTKYFNNKTEKLYSDASYFGESINKNKMKNNNLELIKRLDKFFYLSENNDALNHWEEYKRNILKESNIETWEEYAKISSLKEEVNTATGLIRLHNLTPRADLFLKTENYLYRPTKEYCYKVDMVMNPYADKEGNIYFDNEDTAKQYADSSRGKYEYVGKEKIKEAKYKSDKKFDKVMGEYGDGTLKTNTGKKVTDQKQSVAIAYSESGKDKVNECDCEDEAHLQPFEQWSEMKDNEELLHELDLKTYANAMDKTENYPMSSGKEGKSKNKINHLSRELFEREFYKSYPINDTKIIFIGKETNREYILSFKKLKFNTNYTNYDLIFNTENNLDIFIKNPLYIEPNDLRKIAKEKLKISGESKKLINKMFDYGFSGQHTNKSDIDESEILSEETSTADMAIPAMPITPIVKRIDEVTFDTSKKAESPEMVSDGKFEKKLMSYDPYKGASNIVGGSKTEIKKKYDCLFENYSIKGHNLNDKKVDKFSVLIENDYKQSNIISFKKKDFAKYVFENRNTSSYIKEGKFDYFRYMNNQTYGSTHALIKEYFENKSKNKSEEKSIKKVIKEAKTYTDYNQWKSKMASLILKTSKSKNELGYWNYKLNEGKIYIK